MEKKEEYKGQHIAEQLLRLANDIATGKIVPDNLHMERCGFDTRLDELTSATVRFDYTIARETRMKQDIVFTNAGWEVVLTVEPGDKWFVTGVTEARWFVPNIVKEARKKFANKTSVDGSFIIKLCQASDRIAYGAYEVNG